MKLIHILHGAYTIEEAEELFTPILLSKIHDISQNVTGFHSGRIDVIAKNDISLQKGEIHVLEINQNAIGCISEKPCCCTSYFKRGIKTPQHKNIKYDWAFPEKRHWYHRTWMISFRAIRTMVMQIWIGFHNILLGRVSFLSLLIKGIPKFHEREAQCGLGNHEHYVARP